MTLSIDPNSPTGLSRNGKAVGWNNGRYWRIKVNGVAVLAHILIYEISSGQQIPDGMEIDHIDGNGFNNRVGNLRLVTRGQNVQNTRVRKDSSTGIKGVCLRPQGYQASIQINGHRHTKRFSNDLEAAIEWIEYKRIELHTHAR